MECPKCNGKDTIRLVCSTSDSNKNQYVCEKCDFKCEVEELKNLIK